MPRSACRSLWLPYWSDWTRVTKAQKKENGNWQNGRRILGRKTGHGKRICSISRCSMARAPQPALLVFTLLLVASIAMGQSYTVTDLGIPSGDTFSVGSSLDRKSTRLNSSHL